MADEVLVATRDSIRILTLNRPEKRNALNDELIAALKSALNDAEKDIEVRSVLIRGAGKDFCSGADLSSLQRIAAASFEENLQDAKTLAELFNQIRETSVPVIAAVHGRALAGGCGLATACDLVIATDTARFGYPEVKIGFVPAMVAAILRRNLGEKKSFELLTQGFEFSAGDALSIGLINRLVTGDEIETAAMEFASIYTKVSASAVKMTKKLLYNIDGQNFSSSLELGADVNANARMTDDCKKGIARFLEKS